MNLNDFLANVRANNPEIDWERASAMLDVIAMSDLYRVRVDHAGRRCAEAFVIDPHGEDDPYPTAYRLVAYEVGLRRATVTYRCELTDGPTPAERVDRFVRDRMADGYEVGGRACERTERIYDPDTLLPYEARSLEVLTRGIASELRRPCASRAAAALRLSVVARQLEDAAEVFSEGARRMAELDLEHYDDRECDLTFDTTKVVDDVSHD